MLRYLKYIKYFSDNKFNEEVIINALKSASCEELSNGFTRVNGSKEFVELNNSLGIDFKKKNIEREKIEEYSKNWALHF